MSNSKILKDTSDWLTSSGIFRTLTANHNVPWKNGYVCPYQSDLTVRYNISGEDLDLDYYANRSGNKIISPLSEAVLGDNDEFSASNLTKLASIIFGKYHENWDRLFYAFSLEYNPIQNYNGDESETISNEVTKSGNHSLTKGETVQNTGTVGIAGTVANTGTVSDSGTRTDNLSEVLDHTRKNTGTVGDSGTITNNLSEVTDSTKTNTGTVGDQGSKTNTGTVSDQGSKTNTGTVGDSGSRTNTGTQSTAKDISETKSNSNTNQDNFYGFNSNNGNPANSSQGTIQETIVTDDDTLRTDNLTETTTNTRTDNLSESTSNTRTDNLSESTSNTRTDNLTEDIDTTVTNTGTVQNANTRTDNLTEDIDATKTNTGTVSNSNTRTDNTLETTSSTTTNNLTQQLTGSESGSESGSELGETTRSYHREGNLGVTTTQQMLTSEIDMRLTYNLFDVVYSDVDKVMCLNNFGVDHL